MIKNHILCITSFHLFFFIFINSICFIGSVSATDTTTPIINTESGDIDNFDDDIDLSDIKIDPSDMEDFKQSNWQMGGFLKEDIAYRLNPDRALRKLRTTLNLNLDAILSDRWNFKAMANCFYDIAYTIEGRDDFHKETLDQNEQEIDFRDFYLDGFLTDSLKLRLGRQIIAWGEANFSQIIDRANSRDMRELSLADLEDIRIPVFASNFSLLKSNSEIDFVAIFENQTNEYSGNESDFDFFKSLREPGITIQDEQTSDFSIQNIEYLVRLFGSYNNGDYSIVFADVYDDTPHLNYTDFDFIGNLPNIDFTPEHKRIQVFGFSLNKAINSMLLKGEVAFIDDKAIMRNDLPEQLANNSSSNSIESWIKKDTIQAMVGFNYSGITNLEFSLEGVTEHILDYSDSLATDETLTTIYLLLTYKALNETVDYNVQVAYLDQNNGSILNFYFNYELIDALTITLGTIFYQAADDNAQFYVYREQDRIYSGIKYSF